MKGKEAVLKYAFAETVTAILDYIISDIDNKGFCLICDVMDRFNSHFRQPLFGRPMGWNKPVDDSFYIVKNGATWELHTPYPYFVSPVKKDANEYEFLDLDELTYAIGYIKDRIISYGFCSVYALNNELGIPCNAGTKNVGWKSLFNGVTIREGEDNTWIASFPKPEPLD